LDSRVWGPDGPAWAGAAWSIYCVVQGSRFESIPWTLLHPFYNYWVQAWGQVDASMVQRLVRRTYRYAPSTPPPLTGDTLTFPMCIGRRGAGRLLPVGFNDISTFEARLMVRSMVIL